MAYRGMEWLRRTYSAVSALRTQLLPATYSAVSAPKTVVEGHCSAALYGASQRGTMRGIIEGDNEGYSSIEGHDEDSVMMRAMTAA